MSTLLAPISLHQTAGGWRNSHLESRHSTVRPAVLGAFPASTQPLEPVEAGSAKKKSIRLKPELIVSHAASSIMKESRGATASGNARGSQGDRGDVASNTLKVKLREPDSSHGLLAADSDSISSNSRGQLLSISTDKYPKDLYGDDDRENVINMTALEEAQHGDDNQPKTAAERRAEKRKMKRFRLTHSQTRFLMSEFTRQAHPNAAHRERLSREIPGLSPRQVQVWFQNRRAKLKRLTSDDRLRMLKSRALPDDFDMAQALHSPYGSRPTSSSTTLTSPGSYLPAHTGGDTLTPLVIDNMEGFGDDEYVISPLSATSPYGTFFTFSHSGLEPDTSPISTTCDSAGIFAPLSIPQASNRENVNFFPRSSSFSNSYTLAAYPQIPRLRLHERTNRVREACLISNFREGPYAETGVDCGETEPPIGANVAYSVRSFRCPVPDIAGGNKAGEYGIVHHDGQLQGFDPKPRPRVRPMRTLPAELQLKAEYKEPPTLQTAPLPVSQGQPSPLCTHFISDPLAIPNTQQTTSTLSLPASPFPFQANTKGQYGSIQHPMDVLRSRGYPPSFEFIGDQ